MAYKIVLDAGHGGTDPGAIYKERKEKNDNLELTLAVGKILEDNGIDVVYTIRHLLRKRRLQTRRVQIILFLSIETAARRRISIRE